jgi:Rad3-related DNA helicase
MEKVMNCGKEVAKYEVKNPLSGITELEYKPIVKRLRKEIKSFLDDCVAWGKNKTHAFAEFQTDYTGDNFGANANGLALETSIADLQDVLRGFSQAFEAMQEKDHETLLNSEIVSLAEATSQFKADLAYLLKADTEDHVFWCEGNAAKGWIKLCGVPLDVGGLLASIWEQNNSGRIFTSATLSVSGSMQYFRRKVGLIDAMDELTRCETFASPFSPSQSMRCGTRNSPELDSPDYSTYVADTVHALLTTLNKNILVLFTANTMLNSVYELLKKTTAGMDCTILAQGFSGNRGAILEEFKQAQRAVLLGADSFWEGVDVPGKACEIVVIPRLPFPVPTHPLTKALCKKVEEEKGESFMSFSVPEAVIKFRQGTGRLIRTSDDRGSLIVLDSRLFTKGYGKQFTTSLNGPFTEFKTQKDMMDAVALFFNEGNVPTAVTYIPIEDM